MFWRKYKRPKRKGDTEGAQYKKLIHYVKFCGTITFE